ncbi:MAG: diacylglycerol kinase family lipid kinase [Deltaproteobacteria bacterium]|nr:diacylglycerol kinase family lipid kinase [Deltaproteobacteria bacterium]
MKDKKCVFIINPTAGSGYAGKYAEKVRDVINKHNLDAQMVLTEKKGHATELAGKFLNDGYQYFLSVGGDGTVNEVAQAIVGKSDVTLGVVSAGTGNDFIQILGFSDLFTDRDWEILLEDNIIEMDVGKCNGNYFLNGMGLGFDAQVAAENFKDTSEGKEGSALRYWKHIIKTIFLYKEKNMITKTNGETNETKCFINTVANGRRFAGDFYLTPKAVANDGLLDVCMIDELSIMKRLGILLKVPKGTHIEDPKVNYYQTDKLLIEFDHDVPHHLDGELFFASTYEVDILPKAMKIIYNPHGNHFFNDK